ncbi:MAG: GlmU family protein [Bacteroidales bacterium]|nr:GlmU family protein [Bacteroidales bacterium]
MVLFDNQHRSDLLPLTFTRPQADIRVGIMTIREKWEKHLHAVTSTYTQNYLSAKFPMEIGSDYLFINASICPTDDLVEKILQLQMGQSLVKEEEKIAHRLPSLPSSLDEYEGEKVSYQGEYTAIYHLWDIFTCNESELRADFDILTKGRISQPLSDSNRVFCPENVFVEEGAVIECAVINAKDAKVYIGKDAEVMENSVIRGSVALLEHAQIKVGAKIYGATTIGPYSKVGGELSNVVIFGYSNKAHDGFMGNSVLGEWCNIGADTNTSNLKNNYEVVKLWNYTSQTFLRTGLQFCGLIMGDHSKCGINVMFNTGTVVGVSANIFGSGYQPNFFPSFHWGGGNVPVSDYKLDVAKKVADRVFKRRNKVFDEVESQILDSVYQLTEEYRRNY